MSNESIDHKFPLQIMINVINWFFIVVTTLKSVRGLGSL